MTERFWEGSGFTSSLGLLGIVAFGISGWLLGMLFGYIANRRGLPFLRRDDYRVAVASLILQLQVGIIARTIYGLGLHSQFKVGDYFPIVWVFVNSAMIAVGYKYIRCNHHRVPDE